MPIITEIKKLVSVVYILGGILSLVVNPKGKPFVPTLKGERRDRIVVHLNILLPFLILAILICAGLLINLLTDVGPVRWAEFLPVNTALGLYVISLLFLCCLACIDQPKDTLHLNCNPTLKGR